MKAAAETKGRKRRGRPKKTSRTLREPFGKEAPFITEGGEMLDAYALLTSSLLADKNDEFLPEDIPDETVSSLSLAEEEDTAADDHISCYLREVAAYPLLSAEEEMKLAREIMEGEKALRELVKANRDRSPELQKLWQRISKIIKNVEKFPGVRDKLLTLIMKTLREAAAREEKPGYFSELLSEAEKHIARIESAKHKLIQGNLRLVLNIAKQYRGRGMTFDDLIQEGNMGLIKAVGRYDFSKGYRFSTYATWWIRQSIIRSIYDKTRTIRLPVHFIEMKNLFFKVYHNLLKELNREPTPAEIAEHSKLPLDKVKMIFNMSARPISLETPIGEDGQRLADFIEDESSDSPMEDYARKELMEATRALLASLHPREEKILRARFGMDGEKPRTLEQIGKDFKVSKERIRQIEKKALNKLRHPTRREHLKSFMNG